MDVGVNRRQATRVTFAKGFDVQIVAIDGTWRRECMMMDASDTGARLSLKTSIVGLNLNEFFLLLSSTGVAFRRCKLAWVNGEEIGADFLRENGAPKKTRKPSVAKEPE